MPSPRPLAVVEIEAVCRLWEAGAIVIAGGGGGIPVVELRDGLLGVEAVVDKDRVTALLARRLGPDLLVMITGVDAICRGFGTPEQRALGQLTVSELRELERAGEFPAGSMGPKVECVLDVLEAATTPPEARALVTSPEALAEALTGGAGTWVRPA